MKKGRIKKVPLIKDCRNTTVMLSPQSFELFRTLQALLSSKTITEMCLSMDMEEKPATDRCNRTVRFQLTVHIGTKKNISDLIERNIRDLAEVVLNNL